jgi:phosphate transport system substrate-binding protein
MLAFFIEVKSMATSFRVLCFCWSSLVLLAFGTVTSTAAENTEVQKLLDQLQQYKKGESVTGTIKSKGSDTMQPLMNAWLESFQKLHPSVTSEVSHNGSSQAPKAVIDDQATFGAMSRDWTQTELGDFKKAHGYDPLRIATCIDMLAIYVHKDNPITGLTLPQIDAIFSNTRKGGFKQDIKTWGDLGLTGEWATKPIVLYGRSEGSGTYKYFQEHALFKGTFKPNYKTAPGSSGVIDAITNDKFAIGYSGIGYNNPSVKVVPISLGENANDPFVTAVAEHAYDESYPLSRYLYLSFKQKPREPVDSLRREFLNFVFSQQGQKIVNENQYLPLPAEDVAANRKKLGLETK